MSIEIEIDTQSLENRLDARYEQVKVALRDAMYVSVFDLEAYIKGDKLSGQVLHVVTNNLRGSINSQVMEEGESITGSVGTNVEYAPIHELGLTVSRVSSRGKKFQAVYPERSFLRSGYRDKADEIVGRFREALAQALQ